MKTSFLITIFSFLFIFIGNAQFLEIGDKWIYDTRDYEIGGGYYSEKIDSIEIVSDTLINGYQYYLLVASEESPCGIFLSQEYLREENDKIYRLAKNMSDEHLMIDFSNQSSYEMNYEAGWFDVLIETTVINDSIGTENLPGGTLLDIVYQRILNNSSYGDDHIYQLSNKIGYVKGGLLFPDIGTGLCDVYEVLNLRCKISGNDTIRVTEFDCHESSISSSTIDQHNQDPLILYPNPANSFVEVDENYEIISIHDFSGARIKLSQEKNRIDLSGYSSGIYFVKAKRINRNKSKTYKIVKL